LLPTFFADASCSIPHKTPKRMLVRSSNKKPTQVEKISENKWDGEQRAGL
jgi:hypothetical protein